MAAVTAAAAAAAAAAAMAGTAVVATAAAVVAVVVAAAVAAYCRGCLLDEDAIFCVWVGVGEVTPPLTFLLFTSSLR
jgi:hypothetical protein